MTPLIDQAYADAIVGHLERRTISLRPHILGRTFSRAGTTCRRCPHPPSSVPNTRLPRSPNTTQRRHPTRQEHHLPQAHRLVHRLLLLGPHHRPLEQLRPTSRQAKTRFRWLLACQSGHRTWLVGLYHAHRAYGYGLDLEGNSTTCKLRTLLVYASPLHCVLHFLVRPRRILHDQE